MSVIVTLVPVSADGAVGLGTSSRALEARLSVGDGVGVAVGEESKPRICSSSRPTVDDE